MEIPTYVKERLEKIALSKKISMEEVVDSYLEAFNDPFVQKDPQFISDEQRHRWCIGAYSARCLTPQKPDPLIRIAIALEKIVAVMEGERCPECGGKLSYYDNGMVSCEDCSYARM